MASSGVKRLPRSPSAAAKEEDTIMYANGAQTLDELAEQYPNRPHNHSLTLPFYDLITGLFNPLTKPVPASAAAKARRAASNISPTEQRRIIIERFFSKWRHEVGDDIYPAMRLILPDKDRERGVYGLKEQTIANILCKIMGIPKTSADGLSLVNWKTPGKSSSSSGDFAVRCFEALEQRPQNTTPGEMRIGRVNQLLDQLAAAHGEKEQTPIFREFYNHMNPEEMQWLIRMVLKQMKIGATERTLLDRWHKDGSKLFNVSSSLRHVCWELWSERVQLDGDKINLCLMQCFQPQLAGYAMATSFDKMVEKLGLPDDDPQFLIEEKLDGERMQLHIMLDQDSPGGYKMGWWSRKGKAYTYLYGDSFEDDGSALSKFLTGVFNEGVLSCILDGEMIAWDPTMEKMLAFGTLKTAARNTQRNPNDQQGWRPLYRVFDCLHINGNDLTKHSLLDRRKALDKIVSKEVPGRFEIHPYKLTKSPGDIEPMLREIVENSSEGLVIKDPHSTYRLNERNMKWIKVKPEYMTEFGENLDCIIIGGYYGSGRRGNMISSFLCGLKARQADIDAGLAGPETCYSFFKVGGGLTAEDYSEVKHHTEGKWMPWNPKSASKVVELAGGDRYHERPDVWIHPKDSLVVEVKAASAEKTTSFMVGQTLRFPRFRRLRLDKSWENGALDMDGWEDLQSKADEELKTKKDMEIESKRRKTKRQKTELSVAGDADYKAVVDKVSKLFQGMSFYVPSGSANPKKSKPELENLIREHSGIIVQQPARVRDGDVVALADRQTARTLPLMNFEGINIITPKWIFDAINSKYLLPYEKSHLFFATDDMVALAEQNTDKFGDSYCRDVDVEELRVIFDGMREDHRQPASDAVNFDTEAFYDQLEAHGHELPRSRGYVFRKCRIYIAPVEGMSDLTVARISGYIAFGNGQVAEDLDDEVTHVVIVSRGDEVGERKVAADIRKRVSKRKKLKIPRIVSERWVDDCWKEETRIGEEDYAPI
ncbi:DNA ligase (ATP) [Gnomoniopsis smithogilvyi]|uniref:DNA ligase n=1 Tax=Gnomoniopsis smithogilvyi TaxID=1191159 RepID=A0A9W8YV01_9PEZI|nr:DNA ligase (ATP) [Gnomoniopsis smithogilvyi]